MGILAWLHRLTDAVIPTGRILDPEDCLDEPPRRTVRVHGYQEPQLHTVILPSFDPPPVCDAIADAWAGGRPEWCDVCHPDPADSHPCDHGGVGCDAIGIIDSVVEWSCGFWIDGFGYGHTNMHRHSHPNPCTAGGE